MQRKTPFVQDEMYHVYNRGIDKQIIFKNTSDYERFIALLYLCNSTEKVRLSNMFRKDTPYKKYLQSRNTDHTLVDIACWVLMPNHFHILIKEKTEGGSSQFMQRVCTAYSMYFNTKYERSGSLFCKPFRSKHVSNQLYLEYLYSYIHLNPLDLYQRDWFLEPNMKSALPVLLIHYKKFLEGYAYSSYLDYVQKTPRNENSLLNKQAFPVFEKQGSLEKYIEDYLNLRGEMETFDEE